MVDRVTGEGLSSPPWGYTSAGGRGTVITIVTHLPTVLKSAKTEISVTKGVGYVGKERTKIFGYDVNDSGVYSCRLMSARVTCIGDNTGVCNLYVTCV